LAILIETGTISGQCGRLKCCLVYEQATYAELRKGLPKLGKRVVTAHGEGRVVEVDVLRQRIRVATGPGEFHVLSAGEVTPLFPSGNPPRGGRAESEADGHDASGEHEASGAHELDDPDPSRDPEPGAGGPDQP
jgi:hypothetical protein